MRVCGEVTVDLDVLRGIIKNKLDPGDSERMMGWIWQVVYQALSYYCMKP